jgi:ribosome-binding protein aMBF1 (putative translation factor)
MQFQDWNEVKWDKRGVKSRNESQTTYLNNQIRKGNVTSEVRKDSSNKNQMNIVTNAKKIEKEEDTFKHKTISKDMAKRIAQARCEKKITQKQLAAALNLPESIIKDIETCKSIYNAVIINKIEKYFNKRVRD